MKKVVPLHWQAHEYEDKTRSSDWYWAVGIVGGAVAITSIILGNILFAIIIVLGAFSLLLYAARKPKQFDVVLDDRGILIDKFFYPYHSLESFWIEDHHEGAQKILIKSQKLFMPYITIPLGEEREKVRGFLVRYIPEVFHSESTFHRLIEYLGF
jgi:hypothetical protein